MGGKKWKLHLDRDNVNIETIVGMGDDDDSDDGLDVIREYVTEFQLVGPDDEVINVCGNNNESLYISDKLSAIINSKQYEDDTDIYVGLDELQSSGSPIFYVGIYNDDLGKNLKEVMSIINLKTRTCSYTKDEILRDFINKLIECGMGGIRSVHAELIIMNQMRSVDDILENPDWDYPNQQYRILTLRQALEANPSIQVTMQYENLQKTLYKPISFRKTKASKLDMFANVQPQVYISEEVDDTTDSRPVFEVMDRTRFMKKD